MIGLDNKPRYFKIIVVEDEELILNHIVSKIHKTSEHFKVVATAMDGAAALELIKQHMPNVVFTDIRIPQINGLVLAEKIHDSFPMIHTVILTGYADFEYAQQAIRASVFEYLLKPVRSEDLSHVLMKLASILSGEEAGSLNSYMDTAGASPKQAFELIKSFIVDNYSKQIDMQTLAGDFSYSPAYLTKIFKKYSDTTPVRFLTEIRVNMAAQLLIDTDIPISAIAERVGYPNQFYFSRIFKQHMHMSPIAYRSTMQGKTDE